MTEAGVPVVLVRGLVKSHRGDGLAVPVLRGLDLAVAAGEVVAVMGASGSGKSTLLHCLAGLDGLDAGEVSLCGQRLDSLGEAGRGRLRNQRLGFVYQFHHLLPEFTALDNVAMPLAIRRMVPLERRERAARALEALGLLPRAQHLPAELSGGERQRVAVARALVTEPDCILADEPTGNLDRETARTVFDRFLGLARERGTAIVLATHDSALAARCDRIFAL
jgi:lipoprotein-releasing system ATP-binding protein